MSGRYYLTITQHVKFHNQYDHWSICKLELRLPFTICIHNMGSDKNT